MKTYKRDEAVRNSIEYFGGDALAAEVFVNKYALRNEKLELLEDTPDKMHQRLAKEFARIEEKYPNPLSYDEIYSMLKNFGEIVPQGSPMFGIGNPFQHVSLSNCFVTKTVDSYGGICRADERIAQISKRRGGVGLDISPIRPKGMPTRNSALTTDGVTVFMSRFSNTTREVAQCIAGDQRVLTKEGLKKIEDVDEKNDFVWTRVGWVRVTGKTNNSKEVYRVTTVDGFEIQTSLDHVFLAYDGSNLVEKKLSELETGDTIALLCGTDTVDDKTYVHLDQYEYKNSNNKPNNCVLPKIIDEDLAYFLGFSYGDGYVERNKYGEPRHMSLACGHAYPEIQDKLEHIINDKFSYKGHVRAGGGAVNKLDIHNKCIIDFLKHNSLLKEKSESICVPEKIIQSPLPVITSFISGYFDADGYASGSKKGYVFSSINIDFLKTIQALLMSFGIISKICCEDRSNKGWKTLYTLSILGAYSKQLFKKMMAKSLKVEQLDHHGKRDNRLTPYRANDFGVSHNTYNYIPDNTQNLSVFAYDRLRTESDINIPIGMLVQSEIACIERHITTDTYDLALEQEHLFWCEGFYVHNSGRRGALMITLSVHHPEIMSFITIKRDLQKVTGANISIRITDEFMDAVKKNKQYELRWPVDAKEPIMSTKVKAREVWDAIVESNYLSAEPGVLFWDTIIRNSPADIYSEQDFNTISTNPCLTGETLVYVADGRGNVSIKELADKGEDVPVFCYDDNGKIIIRKMRHPRITGFQQPIYKVTLDDGSVIRATANHKFRLTDGNYRQVKELVAGDSLKILTRYEASIKDIFPKANSNSQDYLWVNDGRCSTHAEHRLIASYNYGDIARGEIVHHNDYNAQNNRPDNLRVMRKKDHDHLHAQNMIGDKNPMRRAKHEWSEEKWQQYHDTISEAVSGEKNGRFTGFSNDDVRQHAIHLTKQAGRRFSKKEWQRYARKNGLPIEFSKWRKDQIGSILILSKWASLRCGLEYVDADPRLVKTLQSMMEQGYDAFIDGNQVFIKKCCEHCGEEFVREHRQREIGFCSKTCSNYYVNERGTNDKRSVTINDTYKKKASETMSKQLEVFTGLKFSLGRKPFIKEWESECKGNNIPFRLKTKYGFQSYQSVKEAAETFNHRVVSVEMDGCEDVYNGTVDDFHNFFVGGFEGKTKANKKKWIYLNTLQCGELPLCENDSCRLLVLNLFGFVNDPFTDKAQFDQERFVDRVRKAQRLMDDLVDMEMECVSRIIQKIENDPEDEIIKANELSLWRGIYEKCQGGRRTGLGITGLGDCVAGLNVKYGSPDSEAIVENIYRTLRDEAYRASIIMAQERGAFSVFDAKLEKASKHNFLERLPDDIKRDMWEYGRRNISLLTTAPAGSVSSQTQTTSGFEPVYLAQYVRKRKLMENDKEAPDFVDALGDRWKEYVVDHHGLKKFKEVTGKTFEESPYFGAESVKIDFDARVKLQSIATSFVDHAISSTVNLPNDVTKDTISKLYLKAWESGCKGLTIYRDGSRDGVLTSGKSNSTRECEDCDEAGKILVELINKGHRPTHIIPSSAPKRLNVMDCDIHRSKVGGSEWLFFVGTLNGEPYEVFGGEAEQFTIPGKYKTGWIMKNGKIDGVTQYNLILGSLDDVNEKLEFKGIVKHFNSNEYGAFSRLISCTLRHGVPIKYVCEQITKKGVEGDLFSFQRAMARVLKKYIVEGEQCRLECPDCHSHDMVYRNGCPTCMQCGYSHCS